MQKAYINEIFTSVQGEGPWIGERQIFVRFQGCDLACRYCDTLHIQSTDTGSFCNVQVPDSLKYERVTNPVDVEELISICSRSRLSGQISRPWISVTGGEPLLQHEFLAVWMPKVHSHYKLYLETSGVHHEFLTKILDDVDVVSMDIKLPSATGQRPLWDEHKKFMIAVINYRPGVKSIQRTSNVLKQDAIVNSPDKPQLFVKTVVTRDAKQTDLVTAAQLISGVDPRILLVIQPASGSFAPEPRMLLEFQDVALRILPDVRLIPQAHRLMNLP